MEQQWNNNGIRMESKPIMMMIGGPGSGKGTQCQNIVKTYGFSHISIGSRFRQLVKDENGSARAMHINDIMMRGQLVNNNEVFAVLKQAMNKKSKRSSNGLIIDGFPRVVSQAIRFDEEMAKCNLVIYLECSDQVMMNSVIRRGRLSSRASARADDNEITNKMRIMTFRVHQQSIINYYGTKVIRINGNRRIDNVFSDIRKHIDLLFK